MSNTTQTNTTTTTESRSSAAPRLTKEQFLKSKNYREVKALAGNIATAASSGSLNDWERNFLTDTAARFVKFGAKTALTLKQAMTINKCLVKAA